MTPPSDAPPRHGRYSTRHQARLDAETAAKLEALAQTFRRNRAPILRYVIQWAIDHGQDWIVDRSIPAESRPIHLLVEPALLQAGHQSATRHGVDVAAWERQAMRRITVEDFPASWRAREPRARSHDSRDYGKRFMLRLDEQTRERLDGLCRHFDTPRADVIRQLVAQARREDFPESWHLAVDERRQREARSHR